MRIVFAVVVACLHLLPPVASLQPVVFEDTFDDAQLNGWQVTGGAAVRVVDSGDAARGGVLSLTPDGDVLALIAGSARWGNVRIDGLVRFPDNADNYLGVASKYRERRGRADFDLVYIKGNDGYVQVNPHRDWNVSRTIYPELRADIPGKVTTSSSVWTPFRLEVTAEGSHFYVADLTTPLVTWPVAEVSTGAVGLQPRSVGAAVWVDDIRVTPIPRLSYSGPSHPPGNVYQPDKLLTSWTVAGPFPSTRDAIARRPLMHRSWRPFAPDWRGAIVTGAVVDYHGADTVAYFRTTIASARAAQRTLMLSTVDDVAVWVNGRFAGFGGRQPLAWFDVATNPAHRGIQVPLDMRPGNNEVVVRVRGGVYASGGFFAALAPER